MAIDYAALLKDAITQKKSDSYIQSLAAARNAKQASDPNYSGMQSTQDYLGSLGYKPQAVDYSQNISDMIKSNADPYAVIAEGNKRDQKINDNNMTQAQYGTSTADLYKSLGFDPSKYKPPTAPAYQAPQAIDNSGMINTQYGDLITALKAQIQQGVNNKNAVIGGLGEKYQPDKNASEVAKYGQVASLNEQAANQGDRGGIGRQNTLAAMVGGENRLNTINLQQSGEKATLQNDIANLMLEGNIQEAQFSAQKLKDLIANNTNMDNTNYSRGIDTANLTGMLGGQKTMAAQQIDTSNNQWQQTFDQNGKQIDTQNNQWQQGFDQNAAQNEWSNKFQEGQAATQESQWNATMAYQATRDQVLDEQWMKGFNSNQQQLIVDNALKNRQVSIDEYNSQTSRISATKSSSSGGMTPTQQRTASSNTNYGSLTNSIKNSTVEDVWHGIISNPQDLQANIGATNYKSLVSEYNDKYYAKLKNDWSGSNKQDTLGSINSNTDWYMTTLGQSNYDKIVSWATAKDKL